MEEMNPRNGRRTEDETHSDAREYLTNLQCLSSELQRAMEAIVSRELPSLQDSVHVQRSRCARLSDLQQSAQVQRVMKSASSGSDCDLSLEIKAATEVLLSLNRQYSALLTHAGDTLRLLAGLYQGYQYPGQANQGHSRTAFGAHAGHQSWYCEI